MAAAIDNEAVLWLHEHIITLPFSKRVCFPSSTGKHSKSDIMEYNWRSKWPMPITITVSEKISSTTYFCHFARPAEVRELHERAAPGHAEGDARHWGVCAAPAGGTREDSAGRITEGLPSAPSRRRLKTIKSYIQPCLHRKFSLQQC